MEIKEKRIKEKDIKRAKGGFHSHKKTEERGNCVLLKRGWNRRGGKKKKLLDGITNERERSKRRTWASPKGSY